MAITLPLIPFAGVRPYAEADAPFFFGRERETRNIATNLRAYQLTILYGASGVGKSSVLRAGVANRLRQDETLLVTVISHWLDSPVQELKQAVAREAAQIQSDIRLPRESGPLAEYLAMVAEQLDRRLMIILDQFEEYFLYHSYDDEFATEFPGAVLSSDASVNFLISISEESLAKLDRFEGRIPMLFDNYLRLERINLTVAHDTIVKPIDQYNRLIDNSQKVEIESALAEEVLEQVKTGKVVIGEAGRGVVKREVPEAQIETTFLQLVMARLWNEEMQAGSRVLRLETLEKLGGAEYIARSHLDGAMSGLEYEEQDVAASIFRYLVTPSGTKIAYSQNDLAELVNLRQEQLAPVLEKLSSGEVRILRPVALSLDNPGPLRYEIFHDVLAPAILDWRSRYEREKERAETEREIEQRRQEAERAAGQKARIQRMLLAIAMLVGIIMIGVAIYANIQRLIAEEAKAALEMSSKSKDEYLNIVRSLDQAVPFFKSIMRGHNKAVNSAVFSPDGKKVLTSSDDKTARLWNADFGEALLVLNGHTDGVSNAAFSPDGRLVATASLDGTAQVFDAETGQRLYVLKGHNGPVNTAIFSPDAALIATASVDGTARLWDAATGEAIFELRGHTGNVTGAVFSPNGSHLATASTDKTARIWETSTGMAKAVLAGHLSTINSVTYSPDGRLIATASEDWTVRIWDAATGKMLSSLVGHSGPVTNLAFSRDGARLITSSGDRTARIWDVDRKQSLKVLEGHTGRVVSGGFSSDGSLAMTASEDNTASIWDADTGRKLADLRGHIGGVASAAFSPDGKLAITTGRGRAQSGDFTARVWDLHTLSGFHIEEVELNASPSDYQGFCPVTIRLLGRISVAGGSGVVDYRFMTENGMETATRTLVFDSPGSKEVSTTWRLGGPNYPLISGAFYLEVISPQEVISNPANFKIECAFKSRPPTTDR